MRFCFLEKTWEIYWPIIELLKLHCYNFYFGRRTKMWYDTMFTKRWIFKNIERLTYLNCFQNFDDSNRWNLYRLWWPCFLLFKSDSLSVSSSKPPNWWLENWFWSDHWQVSWSKLKYFDIKQSMTCSCNTSSLLVFTCDFCSSITRFEANYVKVTQTNLSTQQQNRARVNHRRQDLFWFLPSPPLD